MQDEKRLALAAIDTLGDGGNESRVKKAARHYLDGLISATEFRTDLSELNPDKSRTVFEAARVT